MNAFSSECSSGCESGWTLYFEHSLSDDALPGGDLKKGGFCKKGFVEEEEEDLSMVSDASSGPPIHYETIDFAEEAHRRPIRSPQKNSKRQKMIKLGEDKDFHSLLDDTASSSAISNHRVWKAGVGISGGRRSAHQEHYGFLHSPITGGNHDNNQWFGSKNTKKWV